MLQLLQKIDATVISAATYQRLYLQTLPVGTKVRKLRYSGSSDDLQVDFQFYDGGWWNATHWGAFRTTERQYQVQVCHRAYPSNLQVPGDQWDTVARCSTPAGALRRYRRELSEELSGNNWTGHVRVADYYGNDLPVSYIENQIALLDRAKKVNAS